ncbi:MAG TPA: hypothetical protein VHI13_18840 [Candidatus Kapabacteria bacterium]|nr:hypothetical protein [Candidatus Kapabacteria bacterium]
MNVVTTSGARRCQWRLLFLFVVMCVLACTHVATAASPVILTITKTDDAPVPVPSGQVFTYTIAYSWSGGVGWSTSTPGTLIITDVVPSALDVMSAAPGGPISTIVGNTVTFTISTTAPSGAGTVQINARFKPGVTCPNTRACNVATINIPGGQAVQSNPDCVTATASNKWQFRKDWVSGCIVDTGTVVYRISVINPSGNDIGGLNLNNISLTDILPPGAVLTGAGVSPFYAGCWSGPAAGTGSVLLTGGPVNLTVGPGWAWWGCYVYVRFPSPTFTAGQVVTNNATLRFQTPCSDGQFLTMNASATNTLCTPVVLPGGWISKWLDNWLYFPSNPWYTPSWAPGCCGTYGVYYNNSGGLAQTGVVIDDNLPPTVDVGNINTYQPPSVGTVTMDVYCYVAGACSPVPTTTLTYTTPGAWSTYSPTGLPGPICRIKWSYTGTINPGNYLYNRIDVCVRSNSYVAPFPAVVAGQNISNTACVTGTNVPGGLCATSNNPVTATAPNILAAKFFEGKAGSCMPGCAPATAGPFYPGDIVRWRMVIANVGSATATPCTITDALPSGFSYIGNPTYYYGPIVWATSNNPTCCTLTPAVPAVTGGISSPAVGATTLTWTFPTLPANCSGNVDYLVIEFDTKASNSPTIPPGNYFNTFTFSAGNLGTPVTSNPAQVTINGYAKVEVYKEVRQNTTGTLFSSSANVQPTGQAEYRLRIKNTGILTLANIYLLDITPHVGDIMVLPPYSPRGSAYDLPISLAMSPVAGYNYGYNSSTNTKNPTRSTLFCSVANPAGGVPPLTPGVFGAWTGPTFSFQIQGLPATTIAPGGTQDFYYIATVPTTAPIGATACNSFGLQVTPYGTSTCLKTEATPACVTVIPPDKHQCDSIWGQTQVDPCCTLTTSILNTLGSLSQLDYHVLPVPGGTTPSGVVQSVLTTPCVPSSTVPSSLAGTTAGSLFFTPPCPNPLGVQIHAASTNVTGEVCIELIATIVQKNGTVIQCRDTVCFHCDPAPKVRCDSMAVQAYPNANQSTRTFTIFNLKAPVSPICSVKITVTPPPGGSGLHGGSLVIDGTSHSWPAGSSFGYTQITAAHGLPASTKVQFNLAVDYGIGWVGTVVVTVYHCDGDSCTMTYGPWDASKKGSVVISSSTDVPDRALLHMHALTFSRANAANLHVRSIAVHYSDPVTSIVAVTGANYPCDVDGEQGNCNDIFEEVHVQDRSMMIDLRRDLDDRANQDDPLVTVVYKSADGNNPTVEIIYYDENGQEVGNETVDVTGGDPPGRAVSGLGGAQKMAAVMGALTAQPNPTNGHCDVGFTLQSAGVVDLDLVDARGEKVATLVHGEHLAAGEHHRTLDLASMSSGVYMVALRVNGIPSVLRLELTK